jgi:(E)-4-hydroxy-3-methylbut-2-enyl-diphosphate synthase
MSSCCTPRKERLKTRQVMVGSVGVGGSNDIRIQSMTSCPTHDVVATVNQIIRLADHGCEIARVTVQGKREALACEAIKSSLIQKGYHIPIVADIHFYPPAAMLVADFVDKVRINPGNFADKRALFQTLEYDELAWLQELERIEETLVPLLEKCKKRSIPLRIGVNHGSLSDRIMTRYGNTPEGMVVSAIEYTEIARKHDFHELIFSMKASTPQVMIAAYRLMVEHMQKKGWDYPLHLGVTEAGAGEDGRIKSAAGIGALLLDGIGDTIRISLTEDPWLEIDPSRRLVAFAKQTPISSIKPFIRTHPSHSQPQFLHPDGTVLTHLRKHSPSEPLPDLFLATDSLSNNSWSQTPVLQETEKLFFSVTTKEDWQKVRDNKSQCILLAPKTNRIEEARCFFEWLDKESLNLPVILDFSYACSLEDLILQASAECGSLLCDGLGDGILLRAPFPSAILTTLSFNILQACRRRLTKTEFISCPSCGRTLFNIQEVSQKIREQTAHLPGVKIAIMGCIVNGPGEMADADFGYVGSASGKVDLYVKHSPVEKGIPEGQALDKLIALIKSHGKWLPPPK